MCGIVGLYLKNPQLESQLGKLFEPMLQAMTDRGPDSAGFAIYGDEVADGWVKLTLQATTEAFDWKGLMGELEGRLGCSLDWFQNASAARLPFCASPGRARYRRMSSMASSRATWWLMADAVRCSSTAASAKLRRRATASKACRLAMGGNAAMG